MRWKKGRRSENVEDRRGRRVAPAATLGIGGIVIALIAVFLGADPRKFLGEAGLGGLGGGGDAPASAPVEFSAAEQELADFVSVVLGDTEDTWRKLFTQIGRTYEEPNLVLFTKAVHSACGAAESAMGPFYCPGDKKVYIDLSFYNELKKRHGAPGDFAQAYVIAHEVGHHVQNLLGASDKVHRARGRVTDVEYNNLSVRLELQADFYAGLWAHHAQRARKILERGDLEEALNAASAIGDDTLQKKARGYVQPESFTHGSAEQRMRWFRLGFETGDFRQGDTFSARRL